MTFPTEEGGFKESGELPRSEAFGSVSRWASVEVESKEMYYF